MARAIQDVMRLAMEYEPKIVQFLRDLIRIPSTSGCEGAAMRRIVEEMQAVGLPDVEIDEIGNVVGRIGDGDLKVLYDSHIDTVGIGDISAWPHDPFEGKLENGIVYGRGASDNKAAIACMVYAARIMMDLDLGSGATLYVVGVPQEEDCDGWAIGEMISREFIRPDLVVLGECTNLGVNRGHRGRCEVAVATRGVSCHASAPERGENAIYKMIPTIKGVQALESKTKDDPFLGRGSIAVTRIESVSGSLNALPDLCKVYIDRRMTIGETAGSTIEDVRKHSDPCAEVSLLRYTEKSWTGYQADVPKDYPTWVLQPDHPAVLAGVEAARQVLGRDPVVSKWVFSTDGVSITGKHGIPTIGFGPGEEKYAHTVNDQVPVDHLAAATGFYAVFPDVAAAIMAKR
ncbi:MAG: YgeY family selenium metabolism-linked hydrolase [Clostridia bacterium]|nr:YgeY family selenium metabolism-linked hydrolase [Clostridia bacterium]